MSPDRARQQSLPVAECLSSSKKCRDHLTVPLPRLVGKKCQQKARDMANQRKDETDGQKSDV